MALLSGCLTRRLWLWCLHKALFHFRAAEREVALVDLSGKPLQKAFARGRQCCQESHYTPCFTAWSSLGRMLHGQPLHKAHTGSEPQQWPWCYCRVCWGGKTATLGSPNSWQTYRTHEKNHTPRGIGEAQERCGGGYRRRMENPAQALCTARSGLGEGCRSAAKADTQTEQPSLGKLVAQPLCLHLENFHAVRS